MALSDAQIFTTVLPLLHIETTEELCDALAGLSDEDFKCAFNKHGEMREQLKRQQSQEETEAWRNEVNYDKWGKPTPDEIMHSEWLDRMSAESFRSHPVEAMEGAMEKIKKMESGFLACDLFSKAREK